MKVTAKPTVRFSMKAWQQMWALTKECPIEISAMGIIASNEERLAGGVTEDFYVKEFHVVKQTCTATSTDMDQDALIDLMMKLREQGVKSEHVCVWWHSHVNMATGHSGTDETQIENFDFDHVCISIITNKKDDLNLRIDLYNPVRYSFEKCTYTVDDVKILPKDWAKDTVAECVTQQATQRINITPGKYAGKGGNWSHSPGRRSVGSSGYGSVYGAGAVEWGTESYDWTGGSAAPPDGVVLAASAAAVAVDVAEDEVELDYREPLDISHKKLQAVYDNDLLTLNEVVRYYAKLRAKDISEEELDEELDSMFEFNDPSERSEEETVAEVAEAEIAAMVEEVKEAKKAKNSKKKRGKG